MTSEGGANQVKKAAKNKGTAWSSKTATQCTIYKIRAGTKLHTVRSLPKYLNSNHNEPITIRSFVLFFVTYFYLLLQ